MDATMFLSFKKKWPWKHKKLSSKVAYLWHFGLFFLSAAIIFMSSRKIKGPMEWPFVVKTFWIWSVNHRMYRLLNLTSKVELTRILNYRNSFSSLAHCVLSPQNSAAHSRIQKIPNCQRVPMKSAGSKYLPSLNTL